jgi:hypothetical protein
MECRCRQSSRESVGSVNLPSISISKILQLVPDSVDVLYEQLVLHDGVLTMSRASGHRQRAVLFAERKARRPDIRAPRV